GKRRKRAIAKQRLVTRPLQRFSIRTLELKGRFCHSSQDQDRLSTEISPQKHASLCFSAHRAPLSWATRESGSLFRRLWHNSLCGTYLVSRLSLSHSFV